MEFDFVIRNFWLGCNELVIVSRYGMYCVIEAFEDWETVFEGCFEECIEYCKKRELEYEESVIG